MSFEDKKSKDFHLADSQAQKSTKKTYLCSVCNITLNSHATMEIHCKGVRHMKNSIESGVQDGGVVFRIPNPEPRKKIPIKLAQKITDSSLPIVGLDFITEYIPVSDDEMEPHYRCGLCDNKGQANCMFSHLIGRTHRLKFARSIFGEEEFLEVSPVELDKIAQDQDERKSGFEKRIKTIPSDEEYPWPSGKAPWLLENGGTGIVPQLPERKLDVKPPPAVAAEASERKEKRSRADWIQPSQLGLPSSSEEAVKMLLLAERMLELGLETRGASSTDINIVKISTGLALTSIL